MYSRELAQLMTADAGTNLLCKMAVRNGNTAKFDVRRVRSLLQGGVLDGNGSISVVNDRVVYILEGRSRRGSCCCHFFHFERDVTVTGFRFADGNRIRLANCQLRLDVF